ncbi:NAD(P)/FAD-dependent oxidoreductase [Noviherbaspirillum malthae]|uniref:NAD(P)/FAD-dependent oxidoreductase n=1 Tax=Noviherbaspirillum malthae TaxID=1260987 RepID=UPI00188DD5E6|nr:NAD(P)/FAD-dependent oxidoreductase [Noviherbaspirillum malthae]
MAMTETDYLVVGAGATAMAFVDTLLSESDASVVMVDRRAQPGGHWNDAYPFVRLHQPSAFYGVNSIALGDGTTDAVGLNRGLRELASGAQVLHHFDQVMRQRFLPSGRVRFVPMTDCHRDASGRPILTCRLSAAVTEVRVRRKMVNATHAQTAIPATHPPRYEVHDEVRCIAPNALPGVDHAYRRYVVVGGGKTGMDTCTWLLQHGVLPANITWIRPRDAWLVDRATVQPDPSFFNGLKCQLDAIAQAKTIPDLFQRLETSGQLLRLDRSVTPAMYHCATVSQAELALLQQIEHVVRLGHVKALQPGRIELDHGEVAIETDALFINCSAYGIRPLPPVPVFDGDTINLLLVRTCGPSFSAALIAYVESHIDDVTEKNALCGPVPTPMVPGDWLRMWAAMLGNRLRWSQHPALTDWVARSRLDGVGLLAASVSPHETEKVLLLQQYRASVRPAAANLPALLAQLD